MSGLLPNSASISAISAACNWKPIYNYEQCNGISTLSNMALLPSKSNSSFTWCCSSSVRALPPYRSWEVKIVYPPFMICPFWHHTSPGNPVRLFLPPPSLSEGYRPGETLAILTTWKTIPLECFGEARLSRNLGLSLFTASRVTLSQGQREIGFRMILFIVFSVTNLCGMAPKLAELIRGWAFDGCFPVEEATSTLFDGFFFSTFTLFRL